MQIQVETTLEDPAWGDVTLETLADQAAVAVLTHLGFDEDSFEISVLGCNDARIADLNADFRGKPTPTNVLSWPSDERAPDTPGGTPLAPVAFFPGEAIELGDIAIAWETCGREAMQAGRMLEHHVTHLLVHGVLHLLGYDHETDKDAALMEGLEVAILARLEIADPYKQSGGVPELNG